MDFQNTMINVESAWQEPYTRRGHAPILVWCFPLGGLLPKYYSLKQAIAYNIEKGVFQPGSRVPPESWYRRVYAVSAITVRRAFSDLIREGVLYARQGKGTYVRRRTLHWRTVADNFDKNVLENQPRQPTRVLSLGEVIEPAIAVHFGLPASQPVTAYKRLRFAGDEPAAVSISYTPTDVLSKNERIFIDQHISLYRVLAAKGIQPHYAREIFSVETISEKEIYTLLGLGRNEPLIYGQRYNYGENNRLFEYTRNYLRSDLYKIVSYHQQD